MIKKKDVLKFIDDWIAKLGTGLESEAIEVVLMMVRKRIESLPEEPVQDDDLR